MLDAQSKPEKYIQSVSRASKILEYIAATGNSVGLSDISRGIDLSKSTTFGLISTLEKLKYVQQDQETGKYSLGLILFQLGKIVHDSMDLRAIAMPFLNELARKYEETVHLAVLSKAEVIYIDKVDSSRSIRIISNVGGSNPAFCTGVGKVLLAGLSDAAVDQLFSGKEMKKYTVNTIVDLAVLHAHLQMVRDQGYAFDLEEIDLGLNCVAAPIRNYQGLVIAAISVSGPSNRLDQQRLHELKTDVMATANLISIQLGYKV